jgi:hypothetical protein
VNDIPWFSDSSGGSLSTRILIHQFIYEGENTLTVNITPLTEKGFGYTTYFEARIIEVDDREQEKIIMEIKYNYDDATPLPAYKGLGKFIIEKLAYKPAAWLACNIQKLENKHLSILTRFYHNIHQMCQSGDIEGFMEAATEKDAFFIERFELDANIRLPYVRKKFEDMFTNWQYSNYNHSLWNVKAYANNRLFTFELANGNSPIEFSEDKSQMKVNIPVYMTIINETVKWVL